MITILHGENSSVSRNLRYDLIQKAKQDNFEILYLDGTCLDLSDIVLACESQSFFNKNRLVVIDDLLFTLRPGSKRDVIIHYFIEQKFTSDVLLWERKSVGKQLIKLKKAKPAITIQDFVYPKTIFQFVDSLVPGNTDISLDLFQKTVATIVPEVIFTMIIRQYRLILACLLDASISEYKRLSPWQKNTISKQMKFYTQKQIQQLYKMLLTIDYQVKTGKTSLDLTKNIERFIISISFV